MSVGDIGRRIAARGTGVFFGDARRELCVTASIETPRARALPWPLNRLMEWKSRTGTAREQKSQQHNILIFTNSNHIFSGEVTALLFLDIIIQDLS